MIKLTKFNNENKSLNINFEKKLLNESQETKDKTTDRNSQIPYEYLTDIFNNLNLEEKELRKKEGMGLNLQYDINEKMRAVIIDWVIEVHNRFKLCSDSLFLSVTLIDRYLNKKTIKRKELQLLSVVSLLVACKCEEIFSPEIRDFVCIMDKSYEKEDIILMEKSLLKILKFEVTMPTALKFYEILSIKFSLNKIDFHFGFYLLELSLLNFKISKYYPSLVAAGSCYITMILFKRDSEKKKNSKKFYQVINYTQEEILKIVTDLCFMYENIHNSPYKAIKRKYESKELFDTRMMTFTQSP
jgi:hypothetical protein